MTKRVYLSFDRDKDLELANALAHGLRLFARRWYRLRAQRVFIPRVSSTDLTPGTRKELERSDFLILLASTGTASSPVVRRELEFWLDNHGIETVLVVLTDGEIAWSSEDKRFDWSRTTALPRFLESHYEIEPLYVDLRWARGSTELSLGNPAFANSMADLAATVRGVPKDTLTGQEVREHRKLIAVTRVVVVALLCLILFSAGAGLFALQKRDEARWKIADSLMSNAETSRSSGNLFMARNTATEAKQLFTALRRDAFEPNLMLMKVYIFAPPPMVSMKVTEGWMTFAPDREHGLFTRGKSSRLVDLKTLRLLDPLIEAQHEIMSIWFSPKGNLVLVEEEDYSLALWRADSGSRLLTLAGHGAKLNYAVMSRDNRLAATSADDGTTIIWDLQTGEARASIGSGQEIKSLAFTPGGLSVLSGSVVAGVALWSTETGEKIREFERPGSIVQSVAVSGDGRYALTGGEAMYQWDLQTGKKIRRFRDIRVPVFYVAFSDDDSRIMASSGYNRPLTRVWFTETGMREFTFEGESPALPESLWSPYGVGILHGEEDQQHLSLRISDRSLVDIAAHENPIFRLEFSPDGSLLVTMDRYGGHMIWDVATGYALESLPIEGGFIWAARFFPDGRRLAYATRDAWGIVDLQTRKIIKHLRGESSQVTSLAISADGEKILTTGTDKMAVLWDVASQKKLAATSLPDTPTNAALIQDGRAALIGGPEFLLTWEIEGGSTVPFGDREGISGWSFSVGGDESACTVDVVDRKVTSWNLRSGHRLGEYIGPTSIISKCRFSPDGTWIAAVSFDGEVDFWETETGRRLPPTSVFGRINDFQFSPDGRHLALVMEDGGISLWRLSRADDYASFGPKVERAVQTLATQPQHSDSLAVLAEWYAFREVWSWALELFEEALANDSKVKYLPLARTYWTLDRYDEAKNAFELALREGEASASYVQLCLRAIEAEREAAEATTEPN